MKYAKKSLGQNFLVDKNITRKITNTINIKNRNIIEIGPGQGALTDEIIKKDPKLLILIEKDISLFEQLKIKYSNNKKIKIFNTDILKYPIEDLKINNYSIFGNLPYNISSQILVKFLRFKSWPPKFTDLIFMFQKELGEKIIAKYPSPHYGRLSILTNFRLSILNKFLISPNCFFPKPKVISQLIHFQPKKNKFNINDINNLEKITNILFSNKRKMINKNIIKILSKEKIKMIHALNLNLRPQDIEPSIYYQITQLYEKK